MTASGSMQRQIRLQNQPVTYELRRSSRRSIGFRIDAHGLRITAPHRASQSLIDDALQAKQAWVLSKLEMYRQHAPLAVAPVWSHGSRLPFLGQDASLTLAGADAPPFMHDADRACIALGLPSDASPESILAYLQAQLPAQARPWLAQRLQAQAGRMGLTPQRFSLSPARSRWGSCNAAGHIRLNWRLIHLPPALVDYVAVHELAHLREMNHSPRFWAIVQEFFPDYQQARKLLREQGPRILHLLERG